MDGPAAIPDGEATCQPVPATGAFYRRMGNPRVVADTEIADPDLSWNDAAQRWDLYVGGGQMIRHATSTDLAAFTFDAAPVLTSGAAPSFAHGMLAFSDGANIGFASTSDGVAFTKLPVPLAPSAFTNGAPGATIGDPELVYVGGTYHLYVTLVSATAHGIAHATSTDAQHWTVATSPVPSLLRASADPTSGGDAASVTYDAVHCRWELWLTNDLAGETDAQPVVDSNMVGVYHATSMDAAKWSISYTSARDLAWTAGTPGEHLGLQRGADIAAKDGGRYMVYVGYDDQNVPAGATLPGHSGTLSGVMTLQLATRDVP